MKLTGLLKQVSAMGIAVALLTGCSAVDDVVEMVKPSGPTVCPDISVLLDASEQTAFKDGPGRDLIDIEFEGEISGVQVACDYDLDRTTKAGTLDVMVTPFFTVQKGAANTTGRAPVSYFVAVTDRDKKIINKRTFSVDLVFQGNATQARFADEPVVMTLPIEAGRDGTDYLIYAGFQLTREQMDYNARKRERR